MRLGLVNYSGKSAGRKCLNPNQMSYLQSKSIINLLNTSKECNQLLFKIAGLLSQIDAINQGWLRFVAHYCRKEKRELLRFQLFYTSASKKITQFIFFNKNEPVLTGG